MVVVDRCACGNMGTAISVEGGEESRDGDG